MPDKEWFERNDQYIKGLIDIIGILYDHKIKKISSDDAIIRIECVIAGFKEDEIIE